MQWKNDNVKSVYFYGPSHSIVILEDTSFNTVSEFCYYISYDFSILEIIRLLHTPAVCQNAKIMLVISYCQTMPSEQIICSEILGLDSSIRFVGIANKMGKLVAAEFNRGVEGLLTREEIEANIITAVLRMKTREDYEQKLGKTIYTFALYEKVKRASIALNKGDYSLLMVSFDVSADHESIILHKILPKIKQYHLIA